MSEQKVSREKLLEWLDIKIGLSQGNGAVLKAYRWAACKGTPSRAKAIGCQVYLSS